MATHLDKVNAAVRSHIDGHEVTHQDYDLYLQVVQEAHDLLRQKWLFKWPQFERELEEWISTGQNFYYRFDIIMAIATYKKLFPQEDRRDMRGLYFGAWLLEISNVVAFVIDDVVDKSAERANAPTVHMKIGVGSAICMSMYVALALGEIIDEVFQGKPYAAELRKMHREYFQKLLWATVMDVPASKPQDRQARLSDEWYAERVELSCVTPMWYPVKVAYLLAGKSLNCEAAVSARKLVQIIADMGRVADDVGDCSEDAGNRVITWTTMKALQVNKELILDHYVNGVENKLAIVQNLYRDMDLNQMLEAFQVKQRHQFEELLEEASSDLPKMAWRTLYEFVGRYWFTLWHQEKAIVTCAQKE